VSFDRWLQLYGGFVCLGLVLIGLLTLFMINSLGSRYRGKRRGR
jgi:hypothetical protein